MQWRSVVSSLLIAVAVMTTPTDGTAATPMHWLEASKATRNLLATGRRVNAKDAFGETALYKECRRGHIVLVDALIRAGARVDIKDPSGWTPLHVAAYCGHLDVVELLVHQGAPLEAKDHWEQTPLRLATHKRHRQVVRFLRERGARR